MSPAGREKGKEKIVPFSSGGSAGKRRSLSTDDIHHSTQRRWGQKDRGSLCQGTHVSFPGLKDADPGKTSSALRTVAAFICSDGELPYAETEKEKTAAFLSTTVSSLDGIRGENMTATSSDTISIRFPELPTRCMRQRRRTAVLPPVRTFL